MSAPHVELRRILSTFRLTGPSAFSLLGRTYSAADVEDDGRNDIARSRERLLHTVLYDILHCRADARILSAPVYFADPHGAAQFCVALAAANAGRGRDVRSVVRFRAGGSVLVDYWGLRFTAEPSAETDDASIAVVRVAKEQRNIAPRFYVALSDRDQPDDAGPTIRVYWHIDASGATTLVRRLTELLNEARMPFQLKMVADPRAYARADAATLYLASEDFAAALPALRTVRQDVADHLYPAVSLFALRLADGLSLAEDPGANRSFGEDRSLRLAQALMTVAPDHDPRSTAGFALLMRRLEQAGIDPSRMYANPGSTTQYGWSDA